jgi:radical SAM protein with 4Fe4S-binding SPASM domain
VQISAGNNIGYFGPYEHLWRNGGNDREHWAGCSAGQTVIGLESDGTVKGCPSLPTVGYAGGNVRELSMEQLWATARDEGGMRPAKEMWGFCGSCYYRDVCGAGCTWTSHSLLGRSGNNPYCHHRALTLAERGRQERIVKVEEAGPASFAIGRFALVEEDLGGGGDQVEAEAPPLELSVVAAGDPHNGDGRVPPRLRMCHGCSSFVLAGETHCPFCHGDLAESDHVHEADTRRRDALMDELRAEIARAREVRNQ